MWIPLTEPVTRIAFVETVLSSILSALLRMIFVSRELNCEFGTGEIYDIDCAWIFKEQRITVINSNIRINFIGAFFHYFRTTIRFVEVNDSTVSV